MTDFTPVDGIDPIIEHVRRKFALKPRVAFAGFGKAGKSSLVNAIYGADVARVSMRTDETQAPLTSERFGIDFTDTPGIGTSKFSLDSVLELGVLDRQHVVVHVLNGASAVSREDERLHQAIEGSSARRVTVVNKADLLDADERAQVSETVQERLGIAATELLMVSAKRAEGIGALVERIVQLLPAAMQDAFIGQQRADLALKARRVRALVYSKAGVCAAVALAPVPVADILVLTPIQIAMITAIGYLHGTEVTAERAGELMAVVSAGVGLREAARQLIKLVPGYGSVVSAAVAFAGTVALGEAAHLWFERQMRVDAAELRTLFAKTAERAKVAYERSSKAARLKGGTTDGLADEVQSLSARRNSGDLSEQDFERALAGVDGIPPTLDVDVPGGEGRQR